MANTFVFNIIFTPKIIHSYWFIIFFCFSLCSKRFLISLNILFLIALFSFFSLERFLLSITVVSFISFFILKRFLISLIMLFSIFYLFQTLNFLSLYVVKKLINLFLKSKSLLYPLKMHSKILSLR